MTSKKSNSISGRWTGPLVTAGMIGVAAVAGAIPRAQADSSAYVITRADTRVHEHIGQLKVNPHPDFVPITRPIRNHLGIVYRPVRVPAATVSRAIAQTPSLPHLARLQLAQTTILVDPEVDYLAARPGHLDENHSIIKAQRAFAARAGRRSRSGVRVIRSTAPRGSAKDAAAIKPRAILVKPKVLDHPQPRHQPDAMPTLPAPSHEPQRQMVSAK